MHKPNGYNWQNDVFESKIYFLTDIQSKLLLQVSTSITGGKIFK